MGRSRHKSRLNLRAQTTRIPHLINPPRLNDISEEKRGPPIFRILPIEVTATLFKLPTQLEQHAVTDTRLGTRTIKPGPDLGR